MQEESIYNLLPKATVQSTKNPIYRSKFSHTIPPTASTFGHQTTSIPKISNSNGNFEEIRGGHNKTSSGATFGKPKGAVKPDPQSFTKKGTGKMGSTYIPPVTEGTFKYDETARKPAIPQKDDKPIMGLVTTKNYVLANAVENMLAQPKVSEQPVAWTKKKEYGQVPKYLVKINEQIQREYEHIKAIQQQEEQQDGDKFVLSDQELKELREGLANKWTVINKEYQLLTHKTILDTIGLRRRKEQCEKELSQIEKDMEKLKKNCIFVDVCC